MKQSLSLAKVDHERKMAEFVREEKEIKEENLRLQRRLQLEMERREALCRLVQFLTSTHDKIWIFFFLNLVDGVME